MPKYDERKVLGLPAGWERPTGKVLAELMKEAGYPVKARDTRAQLFERILDLGNGQTERRTALQRLVRERMGVPTEAPAKGGGDKPAKAAQPKQLTAAQMREQLRRKGYTATVPAEQLEATHQAIVGEGRIPHSYETGTRLQDVVSKPWTDLRVTPEPHQPVRTVTLEVTADSPAAARRRLGQKANRLGLLVELAEPEQKEEGAWVGQAQLVPTDPTEEERAAFAS